MSGYRKSRFQLPPKSLSAFLAEAKRASRELFVDLALASLAPQFSECAKEKLFAAGVPRDNVVNPNAAVDSLTRLVVADCRSEFLKCARRWMLDYPVSAPNDGDYARAEIVAVLALVHGVVGGSLQKTADFLNEGIPTRDLNAHGLKAKHVYDARATYLRAFGKHVKDTGASWDDLEGVARVEMFNMCVLLNLHLFARAGEPYKSLRGTALAKAIAAREDFAELLAVASRFVRGRELSGEPFAIGPIDSNAASPDAASLPAARRGSSHVKQRPSRS